MNKQNPDSVPENQPSTGPNPLGLIGLIIIGLVGGSLAGFLIEVIVGFFLRSVGAPFFLAMALAALPYLGALIGTIVLPLIYISYKYTKR